MRAMTKKLLSTLVVLAMVLSMVPVVGLPAIEANAAGTPPTQCPICKGDVEWTALTEKGLNFSDGASHHYYLASNVDIGDNAIKVTKASTKLCLYLNGYTLSGSGAVMFSAGTSSPTLNVIGAGNVEYSGTGNAYSFTKASVNIYDVTHTATSSGSLVLHGGDLKMYLNGTTSFTGPVKLNRTSSGTEKLVLSGSATISDLYLDDTAYLELADGWNGSIGSLTMDEVDVTVGASIATTKIANKGTLGENAAITLASGDTLEYDTDAACFKVVAAQSGGGDSGEGGDEEPDPETPTLPTKCPKCDTEVTWEQLTEEGLDFSDGESHHYYLASNVDIGDNVIKVTQASTQLCLYLNGYTLSGSGAVMFSAGTKTPTLNVIGAGNVVYSGTGNAYSFTKASVNIYDVTHTATGSGNLVLHGGDLKMYLNGTTSFNGPVKLDREAAGKEQLVLRDSVTISDLYLADTAYLEIADGWTGTIGSLTAPTQVDGDGDTVIPEANVAVLGETLSGTIKFGKGIETSLKNGQLKVEDKFNPTAENSYKSYCQICEKTATWTSVSGALGTVSADAHYYLTEDVTHTTADAWFMEVASGATVHFNMNGCNVTANAEDGTNVLQHGIEVKGTLDLFNTSETESTLAADSYNNLGSLWLYSSAAKATLHDGVKVCTAKTSDGIMKPAVYVSFGTFTMEGGTVYSETTGVQGVLVGNVASGQTAAFVMNGGTAINTTGGETIKVGSSGASDKVNKGTLKGGTISGVVRCASGSVVLDESINPGTRVSVGSKGKLVVNKTWTGTGAASFDPAVVISDYLVPDANGATTGDFSGTLTMFDGSGRLINDNNQLKIVIAKVGDAWYTTTEDAVAAAGGDVITMAGNAEVALTDENNDYYIDAAGNDITVTGTGNLYAIDTENDDYSGYGKWTISDVTVKPVTQVTNGNRYVLILNSDENTYSAHRLDIKIKAVNLRTSSAGLYYTAEYKCDAALAKKVASYGVGLSVHEMPTANFNGNSALTQIETTDGLTGMEDNAIEIYSGAVTNIFTKTDDVENTDTNAENAAKEIYANAYLQIATADGNETYIFGNIGSETVADDAVGANGDGAVYNMGKVLEAINSMVETDQTVNALMTEFCSQWPETLDAINNAYSIDAIIALIPSSNEENA